MFCVGHILIKYLFGQYIPKILWRFSLLVCLLPASWSKEVHATLLKEMEEALVAGDLLGGLHERVLLLLREGGGTLMVLDVVHDLGDTCGICARNERGRHNRVQA